MSNQPVVSCTIILSLFFTVAYGELATALIFRSADCSDVPIVVVSSPNEQSCSFSTCQESQELFGTVYKTVLCRVNIEEALKAYAMGSSFALVTHYPSGCVNPPTLYEAVQVPTCNGQAMQPCNGSASAVCWRVGDPFPVDQVSDPLTKLEQAMIATTIIGWVTAGVFLALWVRSMNQYRDLMVSVATNYGNFKDEKLVSKQRDDDVSQ